MAYGNSIQSVDSTAIIPTAQSTAGPNYATQLAAWCQVVEDTIEAKVTPAGININASLDMASNKLLNCNRLELEDITASTASTLMLYAVTNDLYFTDGAGNVVRLTSGGSINISATGGFTGDYASDGNCEARYTTADTQYVFWSNYSTSTVADIAAEKYVLKGSTYDLTLDQHASPTETYTVTWPAASPTSANSFAVYDASGNMSFSRDITLNSLTVSSTATFSTAVTAESTLTVSGVLTASTDITTAGDYLHTSSQYRCLSPMGGWTTDPANVDLYYAGGGSQVSVRFTAAATTTDYFFVELPMIAGERIVSVTAYTEKTSGTTDAIQCHVARAVCSTGAETSLANDTSVTTATTDTLTMTPGTPETTTTGRNYYVRFNKNGATDVMYVHALVVEYDRPA